MRTPALAIASLASLALAGGVADVTTELGRATEEAFDTYSTHIRVLSSPYMEGRKPGTVGIERAANYIEVTFEQLGLLPAFDDRESYRQPFELGTESELIGQELAIRGQGRTIELEPGEDFTATAYGVGGEGTLPVTFAGYGITAGQNGYLGFEHDTDLSGRAAIVLRFEPMDELGRSKWRDEGWSFAAGLTPKFRALESRGAEAILLVTPPMAADDRAGELTTVEESSGNTAVDIPVFHISPQYAEVLTRMGDPEKRSFAELIELANEQGTIIDFVDGVRVDFDADIRQNPVYTDNVGAILPGKGGLADEYIVIGSHYDHLGDATYGTRSPGQMHLGADDNASGTAGMLTTAGLLAEAYDELEGDARSILFLAFTAEEIGLVGSRHYVENPIVDADAHALMLNMDMIGSLRDELEVGGVGSSPAIRPLVEPIFDRSELNIVTQLSVGEGRSDHASFHRAEIPNLFFFTGLTDWYHSPDDTIDTINPAGAARIATMVSEIALAAAQHRASFEFTNPEDDEDRRAALGGPQTVKVRVGIAPGDYSGRGGGIEVARVFEGTSADEGGIEVGDVITVWNGQKVGTVQDWMPLLASHEPGDTIDITVLRDGEEKVLSLTLKARGTADGG